MLLSAAAVTAAPFSCTLAVTASEAGQQKRLLLLDTDWQQLDSIPISVGRKYFSLATPAAATNAAVSTGPAAAGRPAAAAAGAEDGATSSSSITEGSESDQDPFLGLPATEAAAGSGVLQLDVGHIQQLLAEGALQAGDLVHLRAEQDDSSEADVMHVVKVLTDRGGWCAGHACTCCSWRQELACAGMGFEASRWGTVLHINAGDWH